MQVLDEMLRVARRALIVVPTLGTGEFAPRSCCKAGPRDRFAPYEWFESPNVHFLSMLDFRDLPVRGNFRIVREMPIIGQIALEQAWMSNWRAHSALYVSRKGRTPLCVNLGEEGDRQICRN